MPLTALALVLTAAMLHALWNIAAKKAEGDQRFALLSALMVSVLWLPAALYFGWQELPRWGLLQWAVVLASALVHLLYFNVLLRGYRAADLTVVYPVARGSAPLLTVCAAVLLLGERLSLVGLAGVLVLCGGVFLIAGGPALWRRAAGSPVATRAGGLGAQQLSDAARQRVTAGLRWGLLTGALIAGYTVIDGVAVKVLLVGPVLLDYVGNVLRVPFLLPAALRDRAGFVAAARGQWRHALVVATLGPLGYVLVLYALQLAPLSHVAPAREVSMLFAALLGGRLLGEGDRALRLAGALCIGAGVVGLALG